MSAIETTPILNDEQQTQARALARARRRIRVADLLIGNGYFLVLLLSGQSAALRTWASHLAPNFYATLALYNLVFWAGYLVLTLPLSYFGDYRLEKRYGLTKQGTAGWAADLFKGLGIGAVVGYPLLAALYAILAHVPGNWWLWALGLYTAFSIVAAAVVPVVLMPLFYKFTPLDDADLVGRLQSLAARAGAKVQGVYRWGLGEKSTQANAALSGFGATRRIIISDTMLEGYSPDEIEAVLAHELGHQVHGDIGRFLVVNVAIAAGALYSAQRILARTSHAFALTGLADPANLPLLLLVLGAVSLVVLPLVNGYSRRRENAADGFALRLATQPAALGTALVKLAGQNLADPYPPAWIEWLTYSHPALGRRVSGIRRATEVG
ncbi:MAG TPA: M48 family metallopeptidase [Oscillatoriaceae cyanobacterium]